jgi:hypothetical protein
MPKRWPRAILVESDSRWEETAYPGFGSRQDQRVRANRWPKCQVVTDRHGFGRGGPSLFLAVRSMGRVIARGCLRASVLRLARGTPVVCSRGWEWLSLNWRRSPSTQPPSPHDTAGCGRVAFRIVSASSRAAIVRRAGIN